MNHQRLKQALYLFMGIALFMGACYPKGPRFVDELDAVGTRFDTTFNFQTNQTYFLIEEVVNIFDSMNMDNNTDPPTVSDQLIIDKVRENMDAYGYQEVDTAGGVEPDVVILLGAWNTTNLGVSCFPPYWGGWWGGWPGYPGGGWGYYPWGCSAYYAYSTGTLLIQYADFNAIGPEGDLHPIRWLAGINGVLNDSEANREARLERTIDQAFAQSTYLDLN